MMATFELKHRLKESEIKYKVLFFRVSERHLFPPAGVPFSLLINGEKRLQVKLDNHYRIRWLPELFDRLDSKPGDEITLKFEVEEVINQGKESEKGKKKRKSQHNFLTLVEREKKEIENFVQNRIRVPPSNEKLCFWVWFCYNFELYSESSIIFKRIDESSISPDLYRIIQKIGLACESKGEE